MAEFRTTPSASGVSRGSVPPGFLPAFAVWGAALAITALFFWMFGHMVRHGIGGLSWEFLIAAPRNAGRAGGIGPILVSTILILAVCMAVAVPIGIATAALLSEFTRDDSRGAMLVRRSLEVLAGMPSIVFGLFGNALFCKVLGMGFSILSGGLTLACMVLPIFIRSVEEGFRALPADYRMGAAALGLSRAGTLFKLLLPAAAPALLVGLILGVGRALAETAALIFTSGYVDRMPESLLDSGRALSVHIYDLAMNVAGGNTNAYASALVLVFLLLLINGAASILAGKWISGRIVS